MLAYTTFRDTTAQIRGQLKNGLAMIDFYESCDKRNRLSQYGNDYIATLCIKL